MRALQLNSTVSNSGQQKKPPKHQGAQWSSATENTAQYFVPKTQPRQSNDEQQDRGDNAEETNPDERHAASPD